MKHIRDIIRNHEIKQFNKIENANDPKQKKIDLEFKETIIRILVFGSLIIISAIITLWVLI